MNKSYLIFIGYLLTSILQAGCSGIIDNSVTNNIDSTVLELAKKNPVLKNPNVEIIVWGLSCPLCGTNASRSLNMIDGVICKNEINLNTGQILIYIDPEKNVATQNIINAIVGAGFTIKAINPDYNKE